MNSHVTHNLEVFEQPEALFKMAADLILDSAEISIKLRKRFVIALSGGHTPEQLYTMLASHPFNDKIDWSKTFIFWGDERCVPLEDKRNNAHRAEILLLEKVPIPKENIYRIHVDLTPAEAAIAYEETLRNFFGKEEWCFDIILLGLGENGHTASLFPGTPVINSNKKGVEEVYLEEEEMYRVTMTAPLINLARRVLFLVTGKNKADILQKIVGNIYNPNIYPAQLIMPQSGELSWFIDKEAAEEIE
jgi:6-phosphogluconolactonase